MYRVLTVAAIVLAVFLDVPPAHAQPALALDTVYVVLLESNPDHGLAGAELQATQQRHLQYQLQLIADGHTVLGGPLVPEQGGRHTGITVLRAPSRDAADRLAADDPAVRTGLLRATVRTWTIVRNASGRGESSPGTR